MGSSFGSGWGRGRRDTILGAERSHGQHSVSWRGAPPDLTGLLWAGGPGALVKGVRKLAARSDLSLRAVLWTALAKPWLIRRRARWGSRARSRPE